MLSLILQIISNINKSEGLHTMISLEYLRQFRIGSYAIFDLSAAFLGIYLLSPLLSNMFRKIHIDIPKRNWMILTLPMSILVHVLIGNNTQMTKDFLDTEGHILIKIVILTLFVVGMMGIKKIKTKRA